MWKPLHNIILAKKVQKPEEVKTAGGLIIPDASVKDTHQAIAVACGDDVDNVSPGDLFMHNEFAGVKLPIGAEEFVYFRDKEVVMVWEGNKLLPHQEETANAIEAWLEETKNERD